MLINRYIEKDLVSNLERNKIILIYGARQVGKTTLLIQIKEQLKKEALFISGEDKLIEDAFSQGTIKPMLDIVHGYRILFIDEAQLIPDIGKNIKLLYDQNTNLKIILTGSSAFDLANKTQEALTGRTITYKLHPIAVEELAKNSTPFEIKQQLEDFLLYGFYPEVLTIENKNEKIKHLKAITEAYLYKDIIQLTAIKHTHLLHNLLKLLALQIGNLVSLQKLSNALDLSFETVRSYLEILEKTFIIKSLSGLSKNPSKEISKMDKIYFVDVGIRNALINNFAPTTYRQDTGGLWENFLFMERTKKLEYTNDYAEQYFWRKYSGVELDYIESKDGIDHGFEFKWSKKKSKSQKSWLTDYPNSTFEIINQDNYLDFIRFN